MKRRTLQIVFLGLVLVSWAVAADTRALVILHTNDIHDHVRPGYNGSGGFPYVAGYIKSVTAERKDVLVLDAGDVTEKGDMVAFRTDSKLLYELMGQSGYQAVVVGNHDLKRGLDHLRACEQAGQPMALLCANLVRKDGSPYFTPSKVFDVEGVKVGVIGLTRPKDGEDALSLEESEAVAAQEAARLESECHLLVALCHMGTDQCKHIAKRIPAIKVFVGGHTHEVLRKPEVVQETGAIIVQTGMYGQFVGRIDLTLDLEKKALVKSEARLIEMIHGQVPCDPIILAKVQEREKQICPEAAKVVGRCEEPLNSQAAARLAAAALRQRARADVGLCLTTAVIRSGIAAGPVDVNALFLTGGQRGNEIVTTTLKGVELADYMSDALQESRGAPQADGLRTAVHYAVDQKSRSVQTDLDPDRAYRVVLTQIEWDTKIRRFLEKRAKTSGETPSFPEVKPCDFSFIDALAGYAELLRNDGVSLDARARELAAASKLEAVSRTGHQGTGTISDKALRRAERCVASLRTSSRRPGPLQYVPSP